VARTLLLDLNGGAPNEGVALIRTHLEQAGHELLVADVRAGQDLEVEVDGLLATGGPGSPLLEAPWQAPLRARLRRALEEGTALLAICMGFQVIAGELGARVEPLARGRYGIHPLWPTEAGQRDTWFSRALPGAAFDQRRFGIWRGDLEVLSHGDEEDVTAARLGPRAVGCVFHPEATSAAIEAWLDRPEPRRKVRAWHGEQAIDEMLGRLGQVQKVHEALLQGWLAWLD